MGNHTTLYNIIEMDSYWNYASECVLIISLNGKCELTIIPFSNGKGKSINSAYMKQ